MAVLTVGTLIVSPLFCMHVLSAAKKSLVSEESESKMEAVSMRTDSARLNTVPSKSLEDYLLALQLRRWDHSVVLWTLFSPGLAKLSLSLGEVTRHHPPWAR